MGKCGCGGKCGCQGKKQVGTTHKVRGSMGVSPQGRQELDLRSTFPGKRNPSAERADLHRRDNPIVEPTE